MEAGVEELEVREREGLALGDPEGRGLEALGLRYIPEHSLPMLNAVAIPDGVEDKAIRGALLREHGIEIGGGLGPFAGRAWRIGLMGASCTRHHVTALLGALGGMLGGAGEALAAADATYR